MEKRLEIMGGRSKYDEITFLKGFSICTIVIMHLIQENLVEIPDFICKAASIGGTGVHIFLFCSGFGLYLSHIRKPVGYFEFIKRRMVKIYVPYILIVVISALFPFMYEGNRWKALLSHFFLYKMFIPEYESSFGTHLWYMSTLFQFYLLFLPICWIKKQMKKESCFMVFSLLLSVIWWIFIVVAGLDDRIWESFFLQYFWEFALGMVVAEKLERHASCSISKIVLAGMAVCGIGLAAMAKLAGGIWEIFNDIPAMTGYGAFALILYAFDCKWFNAVIRFISGISYELYLVHILIFACVFRLIPIVGWGQYIVGLIALGASVAGGYIYHSIVSIKFPQSGRHR